MTRKQSTGPKVPVAEVHAPGSLEHSLCGLAPEAFESGDHEEHVVFAQPGDVVTCDSCKREIDHVRGNFDGYVYRKSSPRRLSWRERVR